MNEPEHQQHHDVACGRYDFQVTNRDPCLHDLRASRGRQCDLPMGVSHAGFASLLIFQRMLDAYLPEQLPHHVVESDRLGRLHVVYPLRVRSYPGARFYRQNLA